MIACMIGNLDSVQKLIAEGRKRLSDDQFKLFINVKVICEMGGNNALLYACSSDNHEIINCLIYEAGA